MAYSLPDLVANLRINTSQLDRALDSTERRLKSFSGFGTISVDLNRIPLVVLTTLAQQATALTAALIPAAGAIAAIPAAASIASAGLATLLVGLSGLADAFKQNSKGIKGVALDTTSLKRAIESASRGIIDAQKGVVRALREVDDANQELIDATRDVATAQENAKSAQDALNDARKEATRTLSDYQNQLLGAAASEESADISRIEAQKRLRDMERNRESDQLKLRRARNDVTEAELKYKEAVSNSVDLQQKATAAQKSGIEGDERVVAAKEAIERSTLDTEAATRGLAKANLAVADANQGVLDSQERVILANQQLTDAVAALERATTKTSGAQDKAAEALAALSPSARAAVKTILGLAGAWKQVRNEVQEKLFAGVDQQITRLAKVTFPTLKKGMGDVATSFNKAGKEGSEAFSNPIFQDFLAVTFRATSSAVSELTTVLGPLILGFAKLSVAATPAVLRFNSFVTSGLKSLATFLNSEKGLQKLVRAIDKSGDVFSNVIKIVRNLGVILLNIFKAADTDRFLENLEKITAQFAAVTASAEGQQDLKLIFSTLATISENLAAVIPVVAKAIVLLFQGINSLPTPLRDSVLQFAAISAVLLPLIAKFASLSLGIKGLIDLGQGVTGLITRLSGLKGAAKAAAAAADEMAAAQASAITKLEQRREALNKASKLGINSNNENARAIFSELDDVTKKLDELNNKTVNPKINLGDMEDSGKKSSSSFVVGFLKGIVTGLGTGVAVAAVGALFSGPGLIAAAVAGAALLVYYFREPIIEFFTNTLPQFIDQKLPGIINKIVDFFASIPEKSAFALGFLVGTLYVKGQQLIQGLLDGVVNGFIAIATFFIELPTKIQEHVGDLTEKLTDKGVDLIKGLFAGIKETWEEDPKKFFLNLAVAILGLTPALGKVLVERGKELIGGFLNGVRESFEADPREFFLNLGQNILDLLNFRTKASEWLVQVGKDAIQGFLDGVSDVIGTVIKQGGKVAESFLGGFRKALDSHSPSRKMFAEGENIVDGLVLGLDAKRGLLQSQISVLSDDILAGIQPALSAVEAGRSGFASSGNPVDFSNSGVGVTNNYIIQQSLVPYTPEQVQNESVAALRRMELVHLS